MESPVVQVSQGLEGKVAATKIKSFDVHEVAAGKVCARAVVANIEMHIKHIVRVLIILIIVVLKFKIVVKRTSD